MPHRLYPLNGKTKHTQSAASIRRDAGIISSLMRKLFIRVKMFVWPVLVLLCVIRCRTFQNFFLPGCLQLPSPMGIPFVVCWGELYNILSSEFVCTCPHLSCVAISLHEIVLCRPLISLRGIHLSDHF